MARMSMKMDQVTSKAWLVFLIIGVVGLIAVIVAAAYSSSQRSPVTAEVHPDIADSSEIDGLILFEGMLELQTGSYAQDRGVVVLYAELPATESSDVEEAAAGTEVAIAKAEVETNGAYRLRVPASDAVNQYASEQGEVRLRISAEFDGAVYEQLINLSADEIAGAEVNGSVVETLNLDAASAQLSDE